MFRLKNLFHSLFWFVQCSAFFKLTSLAKYRAHINSCHLRTLTARTATVSSCRLTTSHITHATMLLLHVCKDKCFIIISI